MPDVAEQSARAALLQRLRAGESGPRFLQDMELNLTQGVARTPEDVELLLGFAQRAWIADQRNPQADRALKAAQQLVDLLPTLKDGYRALGLAQLTRGEYREAFMTFTAAKQIPSEMNLDNFRALAQNLMLGTPKAQFELEGRSYVFDLSCHNAAAIEAGAFHSIGLLTETQELKALEAAAQGRAIATIVEVGVLMGNHTAYFLKAFTPQRLILADADPANLPFIENTVGNNATVPAPSLDLVNAFIGKGGGETHFAGVRVPHKRLDELVTTSIDLLKIDVDGAELDLLAGAENAIAAGRPLTMIETTPATHQGALAWFGQRGYDRVRTFDHGGYSNTIFRPRP